MSDSEMAFRDFVVTGRVYSGNESHASHTIFWALTNSDHNDEILIQNIKINEGENQNA